MIDCVPNRTHCSTSAVCKLGSPMFQNLAVYFYQNVVASYEAYVREREAETSGRFRHLRTAVQCASVLFHFREHLTAPNKMTWREVYAACPDYRLIANIANTTKHHALTSDDPIGTPLVSRVEDLQEVSVVVLYEDDQGRYPDARTVVLATCSDGVERDVDIALTNVLNFWGGQLQAWGVTNYQARPVPYRPGSALISRERAKSPGLEALKGIDFTQRMRLKEWDARTETANPVDLTGKELQFRVYKPSYKLGLGFTHPNYPDEEPVEIEFDLTDEESARVHAAQNDAERNAVYTALADARREEIHSQVKELIEGRRGEGDDRD